MPTCLNCEHFAADHQGMGPQCLLAIMPPEGATHRQVKARVKACERAILESRLPEMKGCQVLEIGPGVSRWIRRLIETQGIYSGVDPMWDNNPERGCFRGTASALPFSDESFDWVVSFSSIEHWNEHGDTLENGLQDVYRVLKPGGKALITAPWHNHGHDDFYRGRREIVMERVVSSAQWKYAEMGEWASDPTPLPALQEWRKQGWRIPKLLEELGGVEPVTSTMELILVK